MQKIINKSTAIRSIIIIIGLCLVFTVFPLGIWTQTITETIPRVTNDIIGDVTQEKMAQQTFIAGYDYLHSIRIFISSGSHGQAFYFRMLGPAPYHQLMIEDSITLDQGNIPGYYDILINQSLELDETYSYIIQAKTEDTKVFLGVEWFFRDEFPNAGRLYYNSLPMSGQSLAVSYTYKIPLHIGYATAIIAAIILVMLVLCSVIGFYYKRNPEKDTLHVTCQIVKVIFNPLIIIFVVAGLVAVWFNIFGPELVDNIFSTIAILVGGGVCWYGVNHNRDGQTPVLTKETLLKSWPDYLQSVFIAGVLYACFEYRDALYSLNQSIAQKKQIVFFGLVIFAMMAWRQIFNMVNLVILTIVGGYAYYYYVEEVRAGMDELSIHELENIKLEAWVIVIGGMVIFCIMVNVVTALIKKEMKPISVAFGFLMLLFLSLMVVFRNTREWPILMAVCFTLFYLQYGVSRRPDIVLNMCRGLIFSFIWMVGYSLLYRPFTTFETVRYPMFFHTVTVTATYLALVATAVLIILVFKMRTTQRLRDLWKEYVLMGTVASYLFMTISNTGVYSFIIITIFSLLVFTIGKGKQKVRNILSSAFAIILSLIICFPVIFFLQRNIPALVGKPKSHGIYGIELFHQDVTRGRNPASFEYMKLGRFVDVFCHTFFNTPSDSIDFYNRDYIDEMVFIGLKMYWIEDAKELGLDLDNAIPAKDVKKELIENPESFSEDELSTLKPTLHILEERDFTNGRIDHFRVYFAELNAFGHEKMGAMMPDGRLAFHAHNIYLQFAYDHGIYMGILFIVVGAVAFIRAIIYYRRNIDKEKYAALPLAIIAYVATAGLAEWIFHFSDPSGFMLMMMMAPLIFTHHKTNEVKEVI